MEYSFLCNLDKAREDIKTLSKEEILRFSSFAQGGGTRICPLNVYQDDKARSICKVKEGKPCRKNFATCWKKYFKAVEGNE